ncbi:hypothetical protein BV22DRAFT_775737 [Leucogyrophana mollusca]|uniref:Uncharacterized protein n=1 Tax=Leucogyrophana mollusca TaxID=85980 RepID=A0ACB8B5P1_9AGAM|nr:hypothetical protein BV22DRAFT_775737 [Leucogyrophana mollusca]
MGFRPRGDLVNNESVQCALLLERCDIQVNVPRGGYQDAADIQPLENFQRQHWPRATQATRKYPHNPTQPNLQGNRATNLPLLQCTLERQCLRSGVNPIFSVGFSVGTFPREWGVGVPRDKGRLAIILHSSCRALHDAVGPWSSSRSSIDTHRPGHRVKAELWLQLLLL